MKKQKIYIRFIFIIFFSFTLINIISLFGNNLNNENGNNINLPKPSGEIQPVEKWNITWGGNNDDLGRAIESDSLNNIYVAGSTQSFGEGSTDVCLLKFDVSDNLLWNITWGGLNPEFAQDIALDSSNNIYLTGRTSSDVFLVKFNNFGVYQWNVTWGGDDVETGNGIVIDSLDNIYVAGETNSFGLGNYDIFLIKFDNLGILKWNYTYGLTSAHERLYDLAIDSKDFIYGAGTSSATRLLLFKFNSSGNVEWTYRGPTSYLKGFNGVEVDSYDNIFVCGHQQSFFSSDYDMVLFKFSNISTGSYEWAKRWGGPDDERAQAIAIDVFNDIYIVGDPSVYTPSRNDILLVKFDNFGVYQWNVTWGGDENDYPYSIAIDSFGDFYITGRTTSTTGDFDLFLVKYGLRLPYFINIQENFAMFEGDTSKSITWTPIDDYSYYDSYWILQNGVIIEKGDWDGSQIFFSTLSHLSPDTYNFTCFVNTTRTKVNSSTILVTVLPNHYPQIYNLIDNFIVHNGITGFSLSWHALDIDGNNNSYWIERNSVKLAEGNWNNDTDIIYVESEILDLGIYNYTCFINDNALAINYSSIFVTVINTNPVVINNLLNFTVNTNTTGFLISWHAIDLDGNNQSYWIERNSVRIAEGTWNNDTNINFIEYDILAAGIYNYTCFVNDSFGLMSQSSIFIKINSFPQYSGIIIPSTDTYTPNLDYIFNCSWFDIDGIINEVKIEFDYQNYTVFDNFNGEFTYTFKDLSANEIGYQFRWHAMDNDGAWSSSEWQPFILNKQVVQLLILFNGTLVNLIDSYNPIVNITLVNLNSTPGNLKLFVDSQLIQQVESYSLTNISQYLNGVYNITATLIDQNYTGYGMKWLNIQEISPPVIIFDFSEDYLNTTTPEYYHNFIRINCNVSDSSPLHWVILCENSSGIFINRSMISLGNGGWVYEIDISQLNWNDVLFFYFIANDTWGNIGINDNFASLYRVNVFDYQNPISTISFIPYGNINVINISTTFRITAEDIGSGISLIRYKINDSDWIQYAHPFNFSTYNPGTYEISYYSVDNAGNVEETKTITVVLIKIEESTPQGAIPSFNLGVLFLIISITSLIILFKNRSRLKAQ